MNRVDQVDDLFMGKRDNRYIGSREEYRKTFSSMLQLLLYLCSEEPDMPEIEHPQKRRTFSGGVRSPKVPQVWDQAPVSLWNARRLSSRLHRRHRMSRASL